MEPRAARTANDDARTANDQPRWDEIAKRRLLDLVAAPTFPTCRKGRKHFKLNNHENTKEITKYRTTY